ncbi:hypothetical protein FZI91_16875 [Mycobacterium sp. CBMA271]|uniref:hypothetical protein n=1 Tax=unclassified Mycobacteroides TaxID=2618759 RepID=UPI0012DF7AC7|nr:MULTISPECIES: hypothetical protein [unclassified Mycobacteroides]MUM17123.1 hypothetical protein [Mycobacteroides sp. CBMA 326]MUM23362.1 hypothetical protein [Mycobacteroides sp. CBMA 271]
MGDDEFQRDLNLISSVVERGVREIEAVRREAEAAIKRQAAASESTEVLPQRQAPAQPPSDLEEDDFFQFQRPFQ